jgi:ComF family protein
MRKLLRHCSSLAHQLLIRNQQLLPGQCLLCADALRDSSLANLCGGCLYDLPYANRQNRCRICSLDLISSGDYCGQCLHQPPNFSRSYIPFAYQYPLDRIIHSFKYRHHLASGELLGKLLADYLDHCAQEEPEWQAPDVVIPTPMHWQRRWRRGFNQADMLARPLAARLKIPLATRLIRRCKSATAQQGLSRDQRQKNLRNAFAINQPEQILGKRIALVDDVVTTTATMRELSRLLRNAGAADVQVWALARTPHS